jgi:hypothetical protein
MPGEGPVRLLSLEGRWIEASVQRWSTHLSIWPEESVVEGMSGSPILSAEGAAIGLVTTNGYCPVLVDSLPGRLLRDRWKPKRGR